ncbi:hypothetical protein [Microbulbifer sp.]|uniref:hypothetical protein n=1 Tax=Microbulbifer sp. TaxID=1908541 RepID=UPI00258B52D2|nr:hypothetical protein [Microbulbifer sp.]
MKLIKFYSPLVAALAFTLAGCGEGAGGSAQAATAPAIDAPRATAESTIRAGFARSAESPEMLELMLKQPEVEILVFCIQAQLAAQGWAPEQHQFLMTATNGTGDINELKKKNYSEAESMKHFGPLFKAQGECM